MPNIAFLGENDEGENREEIAVVDELSILGTVLFASVAFAQSYSPSASATASPTAAASPTATASASSATTA